MATASSVRRPDLLAAFLVGLLCLIVYVVTVCPTIYVGDSAEFSEALAVFGVPHPPGYPLYTLLGGLFVRAVRWGDFGHRANLFSAVGAAATTSLFYLWLRQIGRARWAAVAATGALAFGIAFWSQSTSAEVHTFNCLLFVAALMTAQAAAARLSGPRLFVCGLVVGLLITHRNLNILFLPGIVAPAALEWWRHRQWRHLLVFLGGGLAAMTVYLYLPVATAHGAPLAMGRPDSWSRLWAVASTRTYFRHLASATPATVARRLASFAFGLPRNLGLALLAAPWGAATLRRERRYPLLFSCGWIAITCVAFSSCYNVLDVEPYFLPALIALATLAAVGFDRVATVRGAAGALALSVAALMALNFSAADQKEHRIGRQYGEDLLRSLPPDAVLLSFGDTATHALWFLQQVENRRSDVAIVSADELSDWYVETLAKRKDIDWPEAASTDWLGEFVNRNASTHAICLTQPLSLGTPEWIPFPHGLVFCLGRPSALTSAVEESLRFWNGTNVPGMAEPLPRDGHEKMTMFSYGLARYNLIRVLVAGNLEDEARAQARQLVASDPDRVERAIEQDLLSVGKQVPQRFDFGARCEQALRTPPAARAALLQLFDL